MDKASVWRQLHHHHHQQQQQQQSNGGEGRVVGGGGNAVTVAAGATAASPPCRPTGARWTPTPEQVKILKELYYGCGIRSPNPEQIQRIAARLRQYGRIEGKNVFYWFQNHKARERHKKRLGVVVNACSGDPTHLGVISPGSACSGAAPAASSYGFGNGGTAVQMDGSTTTSCWGDSAAAMGASERSSYVQLQDYMGVTRSTGAGNQGAAPSPWPACFSYSSNQTPSQMLPPAMLPPETLPLFPTGGRHGGGEEEGSVDVAHNSYPQSNSNFHWWGAAGANTTTTTTTMTFQQQHHHQLQQQQLQDQQYSYYSSSSNQQQLMMPTSQDAGTSLELTLSSSPYYPARFM